jgi:branched-chain amino acid transport system substrate-binding protein
MTSKSRRTFLIKSAIAAGAVAGSGAARFAYAQEGPIRLGMITSLSGSQALLGKPQALGAEIAVDEINRAGGVLGRKLELIVRDDKVNANEAVAAARELAGNGVNLFFGTLASPIALALSGIMGELKGILISAAAHGNNLTHEDFRKNYFRVTDNAYMRYHVAARLVSERYKQLTNWGAVVVDAELGRSALASFKDGLKQYVPQAVVQEPVTAKFGATDFKNQISTLLSQPIDGLFVAVYGNDEVTFLQQAQSLGLMNKLKLTIDTGSEFSLLQALGKRTPANFWVGTHWYFDAYRNLPMAKQLIADYTERTKDAYPTGFVGEGHSAVYAYVNGIRNAKSTATDAVIAAMEGMSFDTVKGKRTFRKEDHQAICDVNYMFVGPKDNERGWEVIDKYVVDGATVMDDPSPGQPVKYKYL